MTNITDPFLRQQATAVLPVESAVAVTVGGGGITPPTGNPSKATRALLIGGAGTLIVTMADGTTATLTFPTTACGLVLPIAITGTTGGTATAVVAFY
jgi:hypothetical protein